MRLDELSEWVSQQDNDSPSEKHPAMHLIESVLDIFEDEHNATHFWKEGLRAFHSKSANILNEFDKADDILKSFGIDYIQLSAEVLESSFSTGEAEGIAPLVQSFADASGLTAFRFLSAWIYLNLNEQKKCIDECEKVEAPTSSIMTIEGQAFLELGRAEESRDCLQVSVSLNPYEAMSWFLLAKAHISLESFEAAIAATEKCHSLKPNSHEVTLLEMFILTSSSAKPKNRTRLENGIKSLLTNNPGHFDAFDLSFKVANQLKNPTLLEKVIDLADISTLSRQQAFSTNLGNYLTSLKPQELVQARLQFLNKATQ